MQQNNYTGTAQYEKIPPYPWSPPAPPKAGKLPLPKGGFLPSLKKRGEGRFSGKCQFTLTDKKPLPTILCFLKERESGELII